MSSDHLADFFNYLSIEKGLAKNSIAAYRADLKHFFDFLSANNLPIDQVQAEHLISYLAWLRGMGNVDFQIGEASIARNITTVRSYFNYLHKEYKYLNAAANFAPPKIPKRLPKALSIDQVLALIEIPEVDLISLRDRLIIELLYSTGARVSELVDLNLSDLSSSKISDSDLSSVRLKGKGGKERVVPLGSHAALAINNYLTRARPTLLKVSTQRALFLNQRGGRLTRQSAWSVVANRATRAGLSEVVTPHSLRHSFATHLLDGGADVRVVQELLGHASVTTTQIYTLITIDRLREAHASAHPRGK